MFGRVLRIQWWGLCLVFIGLNNRRIKPIATPTVDGGLFGGVVHIVWYFQRQPSPQKYLSLYTNSMPASIREFTTKNRNCEDIAMSFLIANAPPIWVKGKMYEIGSTGISSI